MTQQSRLSRMFSYRARDQVAPLENFTTEALAQAVSLDDAPMRLAIRRISWVANRPMGFDVVGTLLPETQVNIGRGTLDLALATTSGPEQLWIEVKVDAPEGRRRRPVALDQTAVPSEDTDTETQSQSQMDDYQIAADSWGEPRPRLIALSRFRLRADFPWLPWHAVSAAITHSRTNHPLWLDLRYFLKEHGVADESHEPISDLEAGAAETAARLIRKVSAIIAETNDMNMAAWPELRLKLWWLSRAAIQNHVGYTFQDTGRMVAYGGATYYGLEAIDGIAYWVVGIWERRDVPNLRAVVEGKSASGPLATEWVHGGRDIARKSVRVAELNTLESAARWLHRAFADLANAGLLDVLYAPSARSPNTPEATPSTPSGTGEAS